MTLTTTAGRRSSTVAAARAVDVTKVYGSGDTTVRALDGVTVEFPAGRFTAVMGPSGSGKSTLMHCVAGLDTVTSGQVFLGDVELGLLSDKHLTILRREQVGFVFQAFNLVPTLTALENIMLPAALGRGRLDPGWLDTVIDTVGLRDRLHHGPAELSGGQNQRVAVARAVASKPAIVFADEPTGNLDSRSGSDVLGFLRRAVDDLDQTVVMVTHDPTAASYADSVVFLNDGRIVDHLPAPISLKNLWGHKRRLVGTSLAVFLGVAFLSGTLVLGDTLRATFDQFLGEATEGTDAIVRNPTNIGRGGGTIEQRGFVDAALVDEIRRVDGVETAEASIDGFGAILDADGEPVGANGPPRMIGNWIDDPDLNAYQLAEGRAPAAADEVVINREAAADAGLRVGDAATVLVPAPVEVTVVGIATFGDEDSFGGTTFAAFTLDAAQRYITGGGEQVSSVLVEAAPGVSQEELVERLEPLVPEEAEALTGTELTDSLVDDMNADFLDALTVFLTIFGGIALLVATFSIYNTFSIIVAQRTRDMALLRAVGARRGQVLASVVVEAVAVGVMASVVGAAAGLGVASLLMALFQAAGFGLPDGGLAISGGALIVSLIVGIVATLVAATAPAVRASRIAPLAALRVAAVDRSDGSRFRAVIGTVVLGAGVAAVLVSAALGGDSVVVLAGAGAVACLAGMIAVGPILARPVSGVLGLPFARTRGIGGVLARQNAMRNPGRTSATASALLVGVGVVVVFTVVAASLKSSLDESIDQSFGADLVARSSALGSGIDPAISPAVAELPEVDTAVGLGAGGAIVDGVDRTAVYADPADLDRMLDVDVTDGSLRDLADDQIAVAESVADDEGWQVGDAVPVAFLDGSEERFIVGAIYDQTNIVGSVLLPRTAWESHALQQVDTAVLVGLADGVDVGTGRAAVAQVVDRFGGLEVEDRAAYAASLTAGFDTMLGVIYVLLALAILIALMGIANTLSLSIHERRRELGILRAVGQTRRQLRAMVRDESVLIALFGTASGVALGLFLAWGLVQAVAASSDRFETFTAPVGRLVVILVVGAAAGVLAGVRPARRAARLDVLDAVNSE